MTKHFTLVCLQKIHWVIWTLSVLYALWKFKQSSEKSFFTLNPGDFENGWQIINRYKDNSDAEWTVFTSTFKRFWGFLCIQICISHIIRKFSLKILPAFYSLYSLLCISFIIGNKAAVFLFAYIVIAYAIHALGQKSFCYIFTVYALILKNYSVVSDLMENSLASNSTDSYLLDVTTTWLMAKGLSFMIDRINSNVYKNVSLLDFTVVLSYCLYLPAVFTGPLLSYNLFVEQMFKKIDTSLNVIISKTVSLCYILTWYFIFEFLLHFIYSSSVQYYPGVVSSFDSWSLCGLGYALPLMFFLKYFIIYGLVRNIAVFENFDFPPPPKCISCLHLSSYLWRHFDRGLYLWILRYLYQPFIQGQYTILRKISALALSFGFVCLWHGFTKEIRIWTLLNFILVTSEMFLKIVLASDYGMYIKKLPISSQRRLYAIFGTPHFILMCLSCIFFLSNFDIGVMVYEKVILGDIIPLVPFIVVMYCACEVSLDVRLMEKKKYHFTRTYWMKFKRF